MNQGILEESDNNSLNEKDFCDDLDHILNNQSQESVCSVLDSPLFNDKPTENSSSRKSQRLQKAKQEALKYTDHKIKQFKFEKEN